MPLAESTTGTRARKKQHSVLQNHLNTFLDVQGKKEKTECIKRAGGLKAAGSQDWPNPDCVPASRCSSSSEHLGVHRGAWTQHNQEFLAQTAWFHLTGGQQLQRGMTLL